MGSEVINLIAKTSKVQLVGGLDKITSSHSNFPIYSDISNISEKPNMIIDFSTPEATLLLLPFCIQNHISIVIATTGFTKDEQEKINQASLHIPIFQSANMSYGIALISNIVSIVSQELKNSEIEIIETHHSNKKDAPSGTALMLANSINKANHHRYSYTFDRHSKTSKRAINEIGFSSIRGGNTIGEHQILFLGENETIEIKHIAHSRSIFAEGALKAAFFLAEQKSGLYHMENLF
ncbi:MAG: 4-hydroxy-tetrahydrodipicolinate reductase [Clostridia bacterium]|nr:4-hydroxy-tetrahydrodipicolinate reductase [Clostridia bacterium]